MSRLITWRLTLAMSSRQKYLSQFTFSILSTYQLLKALKYIHSANLLHRDIKPSNILVDSSCMIKICDFGLCRSISSDVQCENLVLTDYIATRWYSSIEILIGSPSPPLPCFDKLSIIRHIFAHVSEAISQPSSEHYNLPSRYQTGCTPPNQSHRYPRSYSRVVPSLLLVNVDNYCGKVMRLLGRNK